jgi:hypothetical protein
VEPNPERLFISMFGPKHHPFSNVLADIGLEPDMIQVNLDGKRWTNESTGLHELTATIADQPKQLSWSIQSRDQIAAIADRFVSNPAFASKANLYKTWEVEFKEEAVLPINPPVRMGNTLEELAEACGMPADAFVETIKEYNAFCAKGEDAAFGKDAQFLKPVEGNGPFYAILGKRFSEAAMGGVTVDGQCRVLKNDGSFIPGLYAGGDCTSAMHRRGKLAVISELTWATASAYPAGGKAVEYITNKNGGAEVC